MSESIDLSRAVEHLQKIEHDTAMAYNQLLEIKAILERIAAAVERIQKD